MHRQLLADQLREWSLAEHNFRELDQILTKDIFLNDIRFRIQCNPNRIQSSAANISTSAIQERPCFLCEKNRPSEQKGISFEEFTILVNPFPVFPMHFTIANGHEPQAIKGRFGSFLRLAKQMDDCVVFYNGPKCGASAPDHMHFQAGSKGSLPIENLIQYRSAIQNTESIEGRSEAKLNIESSLRSNTNLVYSTNTVQLSELKGLYRSGWFLEGNDEQSLTTVFDHLFEALQGQSLNTEEEPMLNLLAWYESENWFCIILPRKAHRPSCYFKVGADKLLISPASVEMAGLIITARLEDYERIDGKILKQIFEEVSLDEKTVSLISSRFLENTEEPLLEVGIVSAHEFPFEFPTPYHMVGSSSEKNYKGTFSARFENGQVEFEGKLYESIEFEPLKPNEAQFILPKVKIGIGFHWERTEKQAFEGRLKLLVENEKITAVNRVPLESYLSSVISSEMSAKASEELLKAHAVISRSWLLSQLQQKGKNKNGTPSFIETETERIRWYDREDHTLYDVCADDHCQRYQGCTKASTPQVRAAIKATRGQVLTFGTEICDARFSKCCGGAMETFENCWENSPKPYLQGLADVKNSKITPLPDFNIEKDAKAWILGKPEAFCQTTDTHILEQVLNNYDQETTDFYRWSVSYTTAEISEMALRRSGIDFGTIQDLIPIERGVSGRLIRLKIVGSKRTLILGKELEIRRTLSNSHLYSSAFVVEKNNDGFCLHGAGWGHGVGLCQIGAAVMGEQGFQYGEILEHYYPETNIKTLYL